MARRPPRGSSIASPAKDRAEFKIALSILCPKHSFDEATVATLYEELARVIGRWYSEEGREDASAVAGTLKAMRTNLLDASRTLSGHETGFRSGVEIETISTLSEYLAKDPTVRSIRDAHALMASFRETATRIAHAALAAMADLEQQKAPPGRPAFAWYDDFTALLLHIAELAGISPRLRKDRVDGTLSGWLLEAAQALEPFFPEGGMRSAGPAAKSRAILTP